MDNISRRDFLMLAGAVGAVAMLPGCTRATTRINNPYAPPAVDRFTDSPYRFGLHVDESDFARNLHQRELDTGRGVDTVLTFAKITDPVRPDLAKLLDAGYDVALTLEYWSDRNKPADPNYSLKKIANGDHDAEAAKWFEFIATLPRPIHLRPLHEGNGDWYPWGVITEGNAISDYAPAMRHVVDQARDIAGDKVISQFCVNRIAGQNRNVQASALYPGDAYIDEVVINAYNRPAKDASQSFASLIDSYYGQLKALAPNKPLWIGETASTEKFGDKPQWIIDMFASLRTLYPVDTLTWFDERITVVGEPVRDWNMDSSPESLAAFKAGITAK